MALLKKIHRLEHDQDLDGSCLIDITDDDTQEATNNIKLETRRRMDKESHPTLARLMTTRDQSTVTNLSYGSVNPDPWEFMPPARPGQEV